MYGTLMADPTSTGADVSSNALLTAWDSYRAVAAAPRRRPIRVPGRHPGVFGDAVAETAGLTWTVRPGAPLGAVVRPRLRPRLSTGERQPEDAAVHGKPLLGEPPGIVGQRIALADVFGLRCDLGLPAARGRPARGVGAMCSFRRAPLDHRCPCVSCWCPGTTGRHRRCRSAQAPSSSLASRRGSSSQSDRGDR